MPTPTHRLSLWIILGCLLAQLALAGAPLWHHHHEEASDQCSVCAAVLCTSTGDMPALVVHAIPAPCVEFLAIVVETDGSAITAKTVQARGPPALRRA